MKKLAATLVLGLSVMRATTAEMPATFVKLVGLSTVPDARCAFLLVLEANRPLLSEVVLAEGKKSGALELVAIDDQAMTATIRNGGRESMLSFTAEGPVAPPARTLASDAGKRPGAIKFQNVTVAGLLDFYSQLSARTMLRSSFSSVGMLSGQGQGAGREEAIRFLERTVIRAHLQILPQGEKFAVVLPADLALPAAALWKARKSPVDDVHRAAVIPLGMLALHNAELAHVWPIYEHVSGFKVERPAGFQNVPVSFKMQTPLTGSEALYALDTVLALNGVQIVPVNSQSVKAVPAALLAKPPAPIAKNKPSVSK